MRKISILVLILLFILPHDISISRSNPRAVLKLFQTASEARVTKLLEIGGISGGNRGNLASWELSSTTAGVYVTNFFSSQSVPKIVGGVLIQVAVAGGPNETTALKGLYRYLCRLLIIL